MTSKKEAIQKKEQQDLEQTRNRPVYLPFTDIVEGEEGLTITMDLPGVVEKAVDIRLENDVLTVVGKIDEYGFEGYRPLYAEYESGDFQRSFRVLDDFDADKIDAKLSNGVLNIFLPKAEAKKPRTIAIKAT